MEQRVAVVGATGYVGRTLVPALLALGRPVTMIARRRPDAVPHGARFVRCDARDATSLADNLRDSGQVVNAMTGSPAAIAQVAMNLAAWVSATSTGTGICLVHLSSLAVFGQRNGVLYEDTPPLPARKHQYALAKQRAELILYANPIVAALSAILRPGCIYGANAPVWSCRIARLLLSGRLGWLGAEGRGWCHLVHVNDLAASVISALSAGTDAAGIHHVLAPDVLTWNEYFRSFGSHLGLHSVANIARPQLVAETWFAAPFAQVAGKFGAPSADMITPTMRHLFRNRALATCCRPPLLPTAAFRKLNAGLSDAAQSTLYHNASTWASQLARRRSLANAT